MSGNLLLQQAYDQLESLLHAQRNERASISKLGTLAQVFLSSGRIIRALADQNDHDPMGTAIRDAMRDIAARLRARGYVDEPRGARSGRTLKQTDMSSIQRR